MPARMNSKDSASSAFEDAFKRLRRLEEAHTRRILPAGYEYTTASGSLQIRRIADGAVSTLEFA